MQPGVHVRRPPNIDSLRHGLGAVLGPAEPVRGPGEHVDGGVQLREEGGRCLGGGGRWGEGGELERWGDVGGRG